MNVFLYTDDILLLPHSLNGMRHMLQVCERFATDLDFKFNSNKSVVLRIGCRYNVSFEPLQLAREKLKFVVSLKYLGICVKAFSYFKFSVEHLKIKFYHVFNCVYSRCKCANSEMTTVELLKSYCLPFLLYGCDAVTLSDANARVLDRCLDRAMYRIFGVCDKDNVFYGVMFLLLTSGWPV